MKIKDFHSRYSVASLVGIRSLRLSGQKFKSWRRKG